MSLATRCTHCGTIFKVVQDQLKVSEGWVRCGRCHEVFNALEGLFDLEREAPPARAPQPPAEPPVADTPRPPAPQPTPHPTPEPTPAPASLAPPVPPNWPSAWPQPEPEPQQATAPSRPEPVWSEPPASEPPAPGLTQFDLDLPGSTPQPAAAEPEAPIASEYPETTEADALESRYLLPREDATPARKRRRRGPDFADAEFAEHLVDPTDWDDSEPFSGFEPSTPASDPTAASARARTQMPAMESPGSPAPAGPGVANPEAAAMATAPAAQPSGSPAARTEHTERASAPVPLDDGFEPESALPPPSQRKGRPGTRGRAPQADAPEFIRAAERKALWSHPTVVGLMAGLSVMLSLTLALQAAHHWRDTLAARQPALQPALQAMCSVLHCEIQAPMQLDDLQVDSVQLVRTASEGPDTYRLTAIVHNKADIALRWPQLDLTLTDPNGAVLVRRMFSVADAQALPTDTPSAGRSGTPAADQAVPAAVPPGTQTTVQWLIKAPNLRLAGYTAELFYP